LFVWRSDAPGDSGGGERHRLYVAISLTVLAVLLFGMLRGG
jgi:hypothetical protein